MTLDDIKNIIQQGEGLKIEFKEAKDSVPHSFYETVASFSNTDGGTILLGVEDNGTVVGIDPAAKSKLQKDLVTALNSRDCINPPLYVQPFIVLHPDGEIMVIQVPASSQVHDHAGRIYSREFESDIDITDNQQKVSELYLRKRNFFSESQIIPHLTINDLDTGLFEKARQLIRNFRSDHPWLLVSDEQMLKDSVLWRKDFMNGQEGLTLAAALIFGKDNTIQSILPAYKVEAMVRIVNKDRWDDRINPPLRTNLIDTYLALKEFINKHLPEKFYMEGDQRIDLRDKIFREVIGNVIVHREYSSALSTEMIITDTSVVITNPNKPLFHGPIDPKGFNPYPKNPNIRKFFTAFGWTDEIGSGIRNTSKFLPLYSGGAQPVFWENDTFKTEIPLQFTSLGTYGKQFCSWLELPETAFEQLSHGFEEVPVEPSLRNKEWKELLSYLVSHWHTTGLSLPALDWQQAQPFYKKVTGTAPKGIKAPLETSNDFQQLVSQFLEKAPSAAEKGTKLLSKRSWYLVTILAITTAPVSRDEMMKLIGYGNRKTFSDLYLQPLLKEGLIERTNKESPRASNQQYVITLKGKAFLGGIK